MLPSKICRSVVAVPAAVTAAWTQLALAKSAAFFWEVNEITQRVNEIENDFIVIHPQGHQKYCTISVIYALCI